MLFLGHSAATAINAGKIAFTEKPMAINYPQWIAFTKYSYSQLKWAIIEKPAAKNAELLSRDEQVTKGGLLFEKEKR